MYVFVRPGSRVISEIDMLQKFGGPLCLSGMQEKDPTVLKIEKE